MVGDDIWSERLCKFDYQEASYGSPRPIDTSSLFSRQIIMLFAIFTAAFEDIEVVGLCKARPDLAIGFALALCLVGWRVWRFSILPLVAPDDPKELPYWIPMLGEYLSADFERAALN